MHTIPIVSITMLQKNVQFAKRSVATRHTTKAVPSRNQTVRMRKTEGRFTTDVENLHGRLAMLGLTGCALDETLSKTSVVQQLVTETGIPSIDVLAFITVAMASLSWRRSTRSPFKRRSPN